MNNIDKFSAYTAKIFAKLYAAFPQPIAFDAAEIANNQSIKGSGPDGAVSMKDLQAATRDPDIVFCADTFRWLYETGYFSGQMSEYGVRVTNAVLTPKSFEALAAIPDVLKSRQPLGQQLTDLAKATASDAVTGGVSQIVGQVIGAAFRGFVGPPAGS